MCGIAGIIDSSETDRIRDMIGEQAHRGPDDEGLYFSRDRSVALGHRRLSIIDLSDDGHQPMADGTGRYHIVYNGEIFNFREIRLELEERGCRFRSQSDTEVILEAFREWGPESIARLNGMFAFAIWDSVAETLFAVRDRLGIKPFYYYMNGRTLVFASEIKALLRSGCVPRELDRDAIITPKHFQSSPRTGFVGIRKLPPAHSLTWSRGTMKVDRYWSIEAVEETMDDTEARERLDALLRDAVRLQMVSDVQIGALLSGGLDSSLIVALMSELAGAGVSTFTIRYRARDQRFERMPDDSRYARRVADRYRTQHHEITIEPNVVDLLPKMIWHLDEPNADPAAINTYLISKAAREQGIVVLLSGMGGDEIFGGYRKYLACLYADWYQALLPDIAQRLIRKALESLPVATSLRGFRTLRWMKRFVNFASYQRFERFILSDTVLQEREFPALFGEGRDLWSGQYVRAAREKYESASVGYLAKMCLVDSETFLPDHNLTYSDKAAMATGVECRPPLIDHRIVEFMFRRRDSFRVRRSRQKQLLKETARSYLPSDIIDRPKAPFGSPLRSWIRGPLAPMVDEYLSVERLKPAGIYNPDFVMKKVQADRLGREDNSFLVWWLLCNQIWIETFFTT